VDAQRSGHRVGVGEAVGRGLGRGARDDLVEVRRQVGHPGAGQGHGLVEVPDGHRDGGVALERDGARQHLEEQDAEGVEVGRRRRGLTTGLLGSDVRGGPHHRSGVGERRLPQGAGDAEVGDLDRAVRSDDDVARLDVPVHDPGTVGRREGGAHLLGDAHGVARGEPAVLPDQVREVRALRILHDDEVGRAVDAVVVDLRDVRVGEPGGGQGLTPEPLDEVRGLGEGGGEHLDGDPAAETVVGREVHLTHAADGDALAQRVALRDAEGGGRVDGHGQRD
jgi:hypothetical protein